MNDKLSNSSNLKSARQKKIIFNMIFIVLVITPFILLEIYVRLTNPYVDLFVLTGREIGPNPIKEWGMVDAFSAFRGRPGQYISNKSINSHGFISTPELSVAKPPDTIRIVFLGGSSTAGTGEILSDEDTWPWQATEYLQSGFSGQNIEFINGALGGYTSFESYGRLWSRLRFFSPDIIVVYHGWNEMYYFNDGSDIVSWQMLEDGDWTLDRTDAPIQQIEPLWVDYLVRPSQILIYLRLLLTQDSIGEVGESKELEEDYDREGLEIWRTNLRLFRETADILDAELFVVKQATLIVPDLSLEERAPIRYDYHGFDHDAHVDAFDRLYRVIDEEIDPDRIIDATTLSGNSEYFYDHVHLTETGATELAELVAEALSVYLQSD